MTEPDPFGQADSSEDAHGSGSALTAPQGKAPSVRAPSSRDRQRV